MSFLLIQIQPLNAFPVSSLSLDTSLLLFSNHFFSFHQGTVKKMNKTCSFNLTNKDNLDSCRGKTQIENFGNHKFILELTFQLIQKEDQLLVADSK